METTKSQPRENAVPCRGPHDARHKVRTWNLSAFCDNCEQHERANQ